MKLRNLQCIGSVLIGLVCVACTDARDGAEGESSAAQSSPLARLEARTGSSWRSVMDKHTGFTRHLYAGRTASLLVPGQTPTAAALVFLAEYPELFGVQQPELELRVSSEKQDRLGLRHVRFQQVVQGVPVVGGEVSVHFDAAGSLRYVTNHYLPAARDVGVTPQLGAEDGLRISLGAQQAVRPGLDAKRFWRAPQTRLVLLPRAGQPIMLAFHVQLFISGQTGSSPANMNYFVDARTGQILSSFDTLHHSADNVATARSSQAGAYLSPGRALPRQADVEASGVGELGVKRVFRADDSGGSFSLYDSTRSDGGLRTAQGSAGNIVTSSEKDSGWEPAAVDGHFNAEVTYDYYKSKHDRDSIDGNGMAIMSVVHANGVVDNANWDGTNMNYGDGQSVFEGSMAKALDVAAHEMTHGVTQHESGLAYSGEAGGLNESMSDIFGCLVEYEVTKDADKSSVVGEDVMPAGSKPMRSMRDPKDGGILTSSGIPQIDLASEMESSLDPHVSSGVANNAFYLMTAGGTQPTSKVEVAFGIGWDQAGKLWYQTQTGGVLMGNSGFSDAKQANLQAADDLGFTENEKNIIECAWIAVDVDPGETCKPIVGGSGGAGGAGGAGAGGAGGAGAGGAGAGGAGAGGAGSGGAGAGGAGAGGAGAGGAGAGGAGTGGAGGMGGTAGTTGGAGAGSGGVGVGGTGGTNTGTDGADESGCACSTGATEPKPAWFSALGLVALGLYRRRRSARS